MGKIDYQFAMALDGILRHGSKINTRNSDTLRAKNILIEMNSTPLISARKTSWKSALREFEWFMSGSCDVNTLHESVRPWWKPFCKVDNQSLPYNYSRAFRRIYNTTEGKLIKVNDNTLDNLSVLDYIPKFPLIEPFGEDKYIHYKGVNSQGQEFKVISKLNDEDYEIQFQITGNIVKGKLVNFKKGIIKDCYYPSVLGEGCYGAVDKTNFTYYQEAYDLWVGMMQRCYNPKRENYKFYGGKGIVVHPRWKCFEYFIKDLVKLPGFEEWLLYKRKGGEPYQLDKDYYKANYYGPDVSVFITRALNVELRNNPDTPRRELFIDQVDNLIEGIKEHPYSRRNLITTWLPHHIHSGLINPTNCHGTVIQCLVEPEDNSLHMTMIQRSSDMVVGLQHNLIQYWAFLQYLAHKGGRKVGGIVWHGIDCHIYESHTDIAREIVAQGYQIPRDPAPQLIYTPTSEEFLASDFSLDAEYKPKITTKVEMIV